MSDIKHFHPYCLSYFVKVSLHPGVTAHTRVNYAEDK